MGWTSLSQMRQRFADAIEVWIDFQSSLVARYGFGDISQVGVTMAHPGKRAEVARHQLHCELIDHAWIAHHSDGEQGNFFGVEVIGMKERAQLVAGPTTVQQLG